MSLVPRVGDRFLTRKFGAGLMGLGLLVGLAMGILVLLGGPSRLGLEWVIWVGMVKLGLAGAVGLLAAGAIVRRIGLRQEKRQSIGAGQV